MDMSEAEDSLWQLSLSRVTVISATCWCPSSRRHDVNKTDACRSIRRSYTACLQETGASEI